MPGTVADLLTEALKWADQGYKEGANDDTVFGRWYGMNNNAWCDMFVSYCAAKTGSGDVVGKFAYCPAHVSYFQNKGQWLGGNADAKAGDIIFFKWPGSPYQGADHVGIVVEDSPSGRPVKTVEGNGGQRADGVYRLTQNRGVILGFGRPAYAAVGVLPGGPKTWFKTKAPMTVAVVAAALGVSLSTFTAENDPNWKPGDILGEGTTVAVATAPSTAPSGLEKVTGKQPGPADIPDSFPGASVFTFGAKSAVILDLNSALIKRGYGRYYPSKDATDEYTAATVAAVAAFQVAQGYNSESDGYPGPYTWRALDPVKVAPKEASK